MTGEHRQADLGRGLRWVRGEIDQSLERVRGLLAGVMDDERDPGSLATAVPELRQVASVCLVARCHGGQLLAWQMAHNLDLAAREAGQDAERQLEELVGASFLLGKYIAVVVDGVPDHPLAAFDTINTLRQVAGQEPYNQAQALAASWRLANTLRLPPLQEQRSAEALAQRAAKHLPVLKQAVGLILREPQHPKAWKVLGQASQQFAAVTAGAAEWALWSLTRSVAQFGPRLPEAARPRVADLLKRQVALLAHAGKAPPEKLETTAGSLLAGWVLLLLRLDRKGSLSASVLQPLGIERESLLPSRMAVIDEAMRRPGEDSLAAVLRAVQHDFTELRDEVEALQRDSERPNEVIDATSARFKALASASRGLGDEDLAERIREVGKDFVRLSKAPQEDPGWGPLAEALLRVEQELNARLLSRRDRAATAASSPAAFEAQSSILREGLINLTRMKTEVDALLSSGREDHAQSAAAHASELCGALTVLGDPQLSAPFEGLRGVMRRPDFAGLMGHRSIVASFADAIASAEYLLEALRDGETDVRAERERLEGYVQALQQAVDGGGADTEVVEQTPVAVPDAAEVDDDLREIFLEEAAEVLEELRRHIGPWRDRGGADELVEIRRAFHTLKGSGRMVGATDIGDFGWSIENLLNRCRDGDLEATPELSGVVVDAVEALPDIIERFRQGASARDLVGPLLHRADVLTGAAGEDDDADAELREVFLKDAEGFVAELRAAGSGIPRSTEVNAWHSLRGGAAAVGAERVAQLAAAAEHLWSQASLVQVPVPTELQQRAIDSVGAEMAALAGQAPADTDLDALVESLRRAGDALLEQSSAPVQEQDPELRLIFCGEAQDLLEEAETLLGDISPGRAEPQKALELQRVFHTFKGSARMAGAEGLGQLGTALDEQGKQIVAQGGTLSAEAIGLFRAGVQAAWALVDAFQAGRDEDAPDLAELGRRAAAEQPAGESPAAEAEAEVPVAPAAELATPAKVVEPLDDSVDQELLQIFLPECDELLDDLDRALAEVEQHTPADTLDAMFRALHTLKGGARMAGLSELGEEAHSLETLVEKMRAEKGVIDAPRRSELQQRVDHLRGLRDAVGDALAAASGGAGFSPTATTTGLDIDPTETISIAAAEGAADPAARAGDTARVAVQRLDGMLAEVGEISMFRSRLEQQLVGLGGQLREFDQTIERLRSQVRNLESATDAQVQARTRRQMEEGDRYEDNFDPLEMDRYTRMQELTRSITESISDLGSLHRTMREAVGESEAMVLQQGRLSTSMQEGLLTTLAVPFARQQGRLARVVRQTATEQGKQARLEVEGGETELDRNVLERIVPAIEHILRNSVVHGIESPEARREQGKAEEGVVRIRLRRESNRIGVDIIDDGGGLNHERIREEAVRRGLLAADAEVTKAQIAQFIFEPGFSTAESVSLTAGRGVGMDAVAAELRQLGGAMDVGSTPGQGTQITIRLPFSLAITQALQVRAGEDYIVPLASITGVARVPAADILRAQAEGRRYDYGGSGYEIHELSAVLGRASAIEEQGYVPVLFVRAGGDAGGGRNFAVIVEHLLGTREVVAKNVGRQVASVPGIGGASIQPDGRVVLIVDLAELILDRERRGLRGEVEEAATEERAPLIMVIDDSITMRRVAERVLTRGGYRVALAKDGADGVAQLQTTRPDAVLLDIEMPRMDGFEVASFIRHNAELQDVPIVMITSRSGEKHRRHAAEIGVNGYLIKPYQEQQLLGELQRQLREPQQLSVGA